MPHSEFSALVSFSLACFFLTPSFAPAVDTNSSAAGLPECRPRGGPPNVFAKLESGKDVRIAYLGGSITEAEGWRVFSHEWFAKNFPLAKVSEIRATMSGTGSKRFGGNVLCLGAVLVAGELVAETPAAQKD